MASKLDLTNDAGTNVTISLDGEVAQSGGPPQALVVVGRKNHAGKIVVKDFQGLEVFRLESPFGAHMFVGADGLAGFVHVIDGSGKETILLDGANGDISLSGADCAEMFEVAQGQRVEAGTVLVMDDAGALGPCDRAYDRRVAGVASGAGNHRPGLILNREAGQGVAVALMGRVFCKVDATSEPIEVGDLLTTSPAPGHAMKASDQARATGTVIGKAMGSLATGRGLIPVLVTLR